MELNAILRPCSESIWDTLLRRKLGGGGSSGGGSSGSSSADLYTWEAVAYHLEQGDYASVYSVGDCVPVDLGSQGIINMQIAAFDVDVLADGSGNAPITWIAKELLATQQKWTAGDIPGWAYCSLRTYVNNTVVNYCPDEVKSLLKTVTKTSSAPDPDSGVVYDNVTQTTEDTIWFASSTELTGIYAELFPDAASRIKYIVDTETATIWRLRDHTTNPNYYPREVTTGGYVSYGQASYARGLCIGFCT